MFPRSSLGSFLWAKQVLLLAYIIPYAPLKALSFSATLLEGSQNPTRNWSWLGVPGWELLFGPSAPSFPKTPSVAWCQSARALSPEGTASMPRLVNWEPPACYFILKINLFSFIFQNFFVIKLTILELSVQVCYISYISIVEIKHHDTERRIYSGFVVTKG